MYNFDAGAIIRDCPTFITAPNNGTTVTCEWLSGTQSEVGEIYVVIIYSSNPMEQYGYSYPRVGTGEPQCVHVTLMFTFHLTVHQLFLYSMYLCYT